MDINFGEHHCKECPAKGQCSLEVPARFFGANPEMLDEFDSKVNQLGDWKFALIADSAAHEDGASFIIRVSMAIGFALARGAEPIETKPSIEGVISSIMALVNKVQAIPPSPDEDSRN